MIVSELNHWEHSIKLEKLLTRVEKEISENLNYETGCTPEFSVEQVQEMLRNSPELSRLNNASNGKAVFELIDSYGFGEPEGHIVKLYRNNFSTIIKLYLTVGHELIHVYDYYNPNSHYLSTWKMRNQHSEARAYYWEEMHHSNYISEQFYPFYSNKYPLFNDEKIFLRGF